MNADLLTPHEADAFLGVPRGRSAKLARGGKIPHVTLPTVGKERPELRFVRSQLEQWLTNGCPIPEPQGEIHG